MFIAKPRPYQCVECGRESYSHYDSCLDCRQQGTVRLKSEIPNKVFELNSLPIKTLLLRYKKLIRNTPSLHFSSDDELDQYYEECLKYEEEIINRTKGN